MPPVGRGALERSIPTARALRPGEALEDAGVGERHGPTIPRPGAHPALHRPTAGSWQPDRNVGRMLGERCRE